jgi:hypothetical protein
MRGLYALMDDLEKTGVEHRPLPRLVDIDVQCLFHLAFLFTIRNVVALQISGSQCILACFLLSSTESRQQPVEVT